MKKRILMAALALSVMLSVGTTSAFAHGGGHGCRRAEADGSRCCGSSFVDANGDGICDNAADGLCPGHGMGQGWGRDRSR